MQAVSSLPPEERLPLIERARRLVLGGAPEGTAAPVEHFILKSWQRCLQRGYSPDSPVAFDAAVPGPFRGGGAF